MSSTVTLTAAPTPAPSTSMATAAAADDARVSTCPHCGHHHPSAAAAVEDAQRQIEALQAQVRMLTAKATAAVDRFADYEDEIQRLKDDHARLATASARPPSSDSSPSAAPTTTSTYSSRLSSFLTSRRSAANLQAAVAAHAPLPPTPTERELVEALTREQTLRHEAEGKLEDASSELEDLSAQLFQQANEMVATERKARAKLEERVAVLERRDLDKRKRLDRLESAMGRIDRVRGMLSPPPR